MIYLKSEQEIKKIKEAAQLVSKTLAEVAKVLEPGVSTAKLDSVAEDYILKHNAKPAFKGYGGKKNPFPGSLCISVNEQVVHGFPGTYTVKEGDLISIDCGVNKDGYFGDSAYTFPIGEISEEQQDLLTTTMESLYKGIEQAVHGNKIGDIGNAIQTYCESRGYGVVRDLVGHGFGKALHEDPSVPNFGKRNSGPRLRTGMTLAVEPMITMGTWRVKTLGDGWTIVTADGLPSAHYEHDIVVREGKAEILSTFAYIEEITNNHIDSTIL
jgi:methionyl aminopeptidase